MNEKTFTPFPILTTQRLSLRQPTVADAPEVFALRSDAEINKYLGRKAAESIDDAFNFINIVNENTAKDVSVYWAIVLKDSDSLIGTICLYNFSDEGTCEIGYELSASFQGQGLMKEAAEKVIDYAFNTLQMQKMEAILERGNQPSIKLLQKLSFNASDELIADEPDLIGYYLFRT